MDDDRTTTPGGPAVGTPFPTIGARDLQGRDVVLPGAFAGERNAVIVAFAREHQDLVDTWVPWCEATAEGDDGFRFYEVPCISGRWSIARRFIDGGMAASIRVPEILQRTFTYYGDLRRLTDPLAIDDRSTISVLALDATGTVVAATTGPFTEAKAAALVAGFADNR